MKCVAATREAAAGKVVGPPNSKYKARNVSVPGLLVSLDGQMVAQRADWIVSTSAVARSFRGRKLSFTTEVMISVALFIWAM